MPALSSRFLCSCDMMHLLVLELFFAYKGTHYPRLSPYFHCPRADLSHFLKRSLGTFEKGILLINKDQSIMCTHYLAFLGRITPGLIQFLLLCFKIGSLYRHSQFNFTIIEFFPLHLEICIFTSFSYTVYLGI